MGINVEKALSVRDNFLEYKNVQSVLIKGRKAHNQCKYSIVIPTYKRASTLKDTIESALSQDYKEFYDIIVCDNNPERNDETERYITSINDDRIMYYKNAENIGMTGNWNRCVELCNGEYMVMVHDDDILFPFFLSRCDRIINKNKSIKFLYPSRVSWNQSITEEKPKPNSREVAKLYKANFMDYFFQGTPPTGILMKKDETMRIGGFYEGAYPASDLYFNIKAIENSSIYVYNMPMSIYRWSVNETLKFKTILGFSEVFNPLRHWMGKKLRLPNFFVEYANRKYDEDNYEYIKKNLPQELSNTEIKKFSAPESQMERSIYSYLRWMIKWCLLLEHKLRSEII